MPAAFMEHSTCSMTDFINPRFAEICADLWIPSDTHRKVWEWVFIANKAVSSGAVGPGKRALGFGVGTEMLPGFFAEKGSFVTATDAPSSVSNITDWTGGQQYSSKLEDLPRRTMTLEDFAKRVEFRPCDMNNIDMGLMGYDFCWSSCCLEHLGNLQKGLDFIENSIHTLKVGGIACHTTEYNCSSDTDTVESGATVVYRKKDIEGLVRKLKKQGHHVEPFVIAPDRYSQDNFVDVPPYRHDPHLKLALEGYVVTSAAIVVRRGR